MIVNVRDDVFFFDFEDFFSIMPPDFFPFPEPEREESDLLLRIADAEGALYDAFGLEETKGMLGAKRPTGAFLFENGEVAGDFRL